MININNQTFTNVILLILILLNMGLGYALWQSNKPHHPPKGNKAAQLFKNKLDLSEAQTKEFIQLIDEHHIHHKQVNEAQRKYRDEFFSLMLEERLDSIKIQENLTLISSTEVAKLQSLVDHYRSLKEACTPEQQKKLYDFFKHESRQGQRPDHRRQH